MEPVEKILKGIGSDLEVLMKYQKVDFTPEDIETAKAHFLQETRALIQKIFPGPLTDDQLHKLNELASESGGSFPKDSTDPYTVSLTLIWDRSGVRVETK